VLLVIFGVVSLINASFARSTTNLWNNYKWDAGNTIISFWIIISVIMTLIGFILFFLSSRK